MSRVWSQRRRSSPRAWLILLLAVAMIPAELMDEFRRSADAAAGDGAAPVRGVPRGWLLLGAALATWVTVGLVGADIIALIRFILARR